MASLTYRGYRWENIDYIAAPTGGWNTDTVPWLLPTNSASVLDNFIIRPGNLKARGPIYSVFGRFQGGSTPNAPIGFTPSATPLVTQANAFADNTIGIAPWDAAVLQTPSTGPFQRALVVSSISPCGTVSTPSLTDQETAPGPRWINFDGTLYGLGITSTTIAHDGPTSYNIPTTKVLSYAAAGGNAVVKVTKKFTGTETIVFSGGGTTLTGTSTSITVSGAGTLAAGATSQLATITNLGLTIPTTSNVVGIEIILEGVDVNQGAGSFCGDTNMILVGVVGTSTTQSNGSPWFKDPTYTTFGSPGEQRWGTAVGPGPTQVNATTFGFSFQITNAAGTAAAKPVASPVQINIYYSASGSAPTLPTKPWSTTGPSGGVDIAGYLSRIWIAQGIDVPGSGTTHSSTTLFWTNPVTSTSPLAFTAADWKNPATGLTNQNVIDHNTSDPIMALAPMRNCMVVFRRNSIYVLRGTTEANFTLTKVSGVYGCLDPRSVQVVDDLTYFVSRQGLCATDGTRVQNVSGGVQFSMIAAIDIEQRNVLNGQSGTTGWVTTGLTRNGQLLISIGFFTRETTQPGQMQALWSGMYDPQLQAWTRITSSLWSSNNWLGSASFPGMPGQLFNTNAGSNIGLWEIGNGQVSLLEHAVLDFSFVNDYQTMDRNFLGIANNGAGNVKNQYIGIPMRWVTKLAGIIGTSSIARRRAQPKRFFLDHVFAGMSLRNAPLTTTTGPDIQMLTSWQVQPVQPTAFTGAYDANAVLQCSANKTTVPVVPYGGLSVTPEFQSIPARVIQRENQDFVSEVDDVMFEITLFPLPNANGVSWVPASNFVAEIYGIGMEFQQSMDARSITS